MTTAAIALQDVTKIYHRFTGRQFATLKSALLQRSILRDLKPDETFPALDHVSFTVPKADHQKALAIVEKALSAVHAKGITVDTDIAKISIVGVGMRTHAGVAATMFQALAREQINIQMISTSEIKISVVIAAHQADQAVRALHDAFITS